jgi:plasmid maintenance system antidote protein VapI
MNPYAKQDDNRLMQWLERRQMSRAMLARMLGFSFVYIYKLSIGERPISDGFIGRFVRVYGLQEAQALFNLPFEASTDTLEALDVQRQSSR